MYGVCDSLRGREHLSVHRMYDNCQSRLYGMYCLCCRNLQKHGLYGLGQHGVYLLCSGHNLQHDHQCGLLYNLYDVCYRDLCDNRLHSVRQSCLYGLRRWNIV